MRLSTSNWLDAPCVQHRLNGYCIEAEFSGVGLVENFLSLLTLVLVQWSLALDKKFMPPPCQIQLFKPLLISQIKESCFPCQYFA
jgi:hypothetical protein